ncbi:MAG: hypothetical protein HOE30_23735 [Deltaproteobacteria bacterium]|nr:hypothetical protein [Deltaproteobacteria bacterium]
MAQVTTNAGGGVKASNGDLTAKCRWVCFIPDFQDRKKLPIKRMVRIVNHGKTVLFSIIHDITKHKQSVRPLIHMR